ncbi:MAG: hypothetical protein HFF26_10545 [Oscillospiraceae bacterium]|nr:hypothetical protein [Oscillospiraceae bacterium]
MSQFYVNGPSSGYAMSAEEFAAGACRRPGPQPQAPGPGCGCVPPAPPADCGCGATPPMEPGCPDNGCGQGPEYCQQMICCCRPTPPPMPQPPQVEEGCCCKQSFRAALGLLCDERISSLLDFDTSAFLTGTYTAGAALTALTPPAEGGGDQGDGGTRAVLPTVTPADNLGVPAGSFRRFAPCSCDLLDISADLYNAAGTAVGLTAAQVNLCQLDAVVIQAAAATAEGDLTAEEVSARNFRCIRSLLAQRLSPVGSPCGQTACSCACDGRDCCCAAGLLSTLAQNNLSRRVSLTTGLLVLRNVQLLGTVGNVLVLANETNNRLYFVCVNSVQFIG